MARLLLDTNVLIRFLTRDHPTHSPRSRNLFARAAAGEFTLVLTDLALAETAWVLQSFYLLDRAEIAAIESAARGCDEKPSTWARSRYNRVRCRTRQTSSLNDRPRGNHATSHLTHRPGASRDNTGVCSCAAIPFLRPATDIH